MYTDIQFHPAQFWKNYLLPMLCFRTKRHFQLVLCQYDAFVSFPPLDKTSDIIGSRDLESQQK